jgi:membrane fusion protein (multidrug efflux system)
MSTAHITIEEAHSLSRDGVRERKLERDVPHSESGNTEPRPPRKSRKALWIGLLLLLCAGVGIGGYLRYASRFEKTDNAFVEADVHPISTRVAGNVQEVLVNDNEAVTQGQLLARLDRRDFEIKLQSARVDLQQAEAQIPLADSALVQARAQQREAASQLNSSNAQLEKARLDFQRAEQLFHGRDKVIAKQEFDAARAALDAAQGGHDAALAKRDAATAGVQTSEANRAVVLVQKLHAETALADASLQLSYTELTAPVAGRVGKKTVEAGQRVQPGQALMAVVANEDWVVANFKENQLARIRPGQPVDITIDAIADHHFRGRIESFAPGTGAKFALLPPDYATGNFTKIVQRVPVKILFNLDDLKGFEARIAPGLSAIATVHLEE